METLDTDHTDKTQKADEPTAMTIRVALPPEKEDIASQQNTSAQKSLAEKEDIVIQEGISSAQKDVDVAGKAEMADGGKTVVDTPTLAKALRRYTRLRAKQVEFAAAVAAAAAVVEKERQDAVERKNANAFLNCIRAMDPSALDSFSATVIAAAKTVAQQAQAEAWIDAVKASRATEKKEKMLKEPPVRAHQIPATATGAEVSPSGESQG